MRNPQGLVPTLKIDGLTLTQSVAILEYFDETRAAGFLPVEPAPLPMPLPWKSALFVTCLFAITLPLLAR